MLILVINLDRHRERWQHMCRALDRFALDYRRVPALDAHAADRAGMPPGIAITAGEYACTQSHFRCWRALLESDAHLALVLEDDARLSPRLPQALAAAARLPADADLVRLETRLWEVELDAAGVELVPGVRLQRMHSAHPGTAGYVVTRAAAERLLGMHWDYARALDDTLFEPPSAVFRELVVYQANPGLVIQHDVFGDAAMPGCFASDLAQARRARAAARVAGPAAYTLDKLDSLAKDLRKLVKHRVLARLRGRRMVRVGYAAGGE